MELFKLPRSVRTKCDEQFMILGVQENVQLWTLKKVNFLRVHIADKRK